MVLTKSLIKCQNTIPCIILIGPFVKPKFFAEYGEVPETQNYLAALHELAGKCRQRQLLLEKQKKYLQQKQKYEALEEQVKDYFVSLQLIPEEHPEEQLAELESHRKDYEKELQEYTWARAFPSPA